MRGYLVIWPISQEQSHFRRVVNAKECTWPPIAEHAVPQ